VVQTDFHHIRRRCSSSPSRRAGPSRSPRATPDQGAENHEIEACHPGGRGGRRRRHRRRSARAAETDIVDTAIAAGQFKTLAAALDGAGLVATLKGQGPFTVFAPTDAAFAKLPAGTVDDLLRPENKAKLAAILTYHVVPGRVTAADVVRLKEAKTVNGETVDVRADGGSVMINDAKVTAADVAASNGVIHVIDTVILPPTT
jgi:uncharacterized surface protein with fasciclin (FAS1) repeats